MSMTAIRNRSRSLGVAAAFAAFLGGAVLISTLPAAAEDAATSAAATYAEIERTLGSVPAFVKQFPKAGIAGAWAELRDLEFSDQTALTPKMKALISLAVAAQIPCHYCVWADTQGARRAGATEDEIAEAVAMSALTRHWSTVFNGLQIDFEQFKKDFGGDVAPVTVSK
jgi:AhpD family alkylhydroperoxidase